MFIFLSVTTMPRPRRASVVAPPAKVEQEKRCAYCHCNVAEITKQEIHGQYNFQNRLYVCTEGDCQEPGVCLYCRTGIVGTEYAINTRLQRNDEHSSRVSFINLDECLVCPRHNNITLFKGTYRYIVEPLAWYHVKYWSARLWFISLKNLIFWCAFICGWLYRFYPEPFIFFWYYNIWIGAFVLFIFAFGLGKSFPAAKVDFQAAYFFSLIIFLLSYALHYFDASPSFWLTQMIQTVIISYNTLVINSLDLVPGFKIKISLKNVVTANVAEMPHDTMMSAKKTAKLADLLTQV